MIISDPGSNNCISPGSNNCISARSSSIGDIDILDDDEENSEASSVSDEQESVKIDVSTVSLELIVQGHSDRDEEGKEEWGLVIKVIHKCIYVYMCYIYTPIHIYICIHL
jgi:hypothetical protein